MDENYSSESFHAAIASGVTLVDFWATWCGPCKMMLPIIDQIKTELDGTAKVIKIDVDDHPDIAREYSVRTVPAFFVIKDGEVVEEFSGRQDKSTLLNALRNA